MAYNSNAAAKGFFDTNLQAAGWAKDSTFTNFYKNQLLTVNCTKCVPHPNNKNKEYYISLYIPMVYIPFSFSISTCTPCKCVFFDK